MPVRYSPSPRRPPRMTVSFSLRTHACATSALLAVLAGGVCTRGRAAITWPEGQALPTFSRALHLDVADIEKSPGEEQLLFTTLQGVVNRVQPRIYLLQDSSEGKETWLRKGLGVPYT